MLQHTFAQTAFNPDEIAIIRRAFDRACVECTVTGEHGKRTFARILLRRCRHDADEDELVRLAKQIIALQRGLQARDAAS